MPSICALRTRSATELDFIFFMAVPRWTLTVISLIPMVLLFLVFRRQIMNSDISSGLKD